MKRILFLGMLVVLLFAPLSSVLAVVQDDNPVHYPDFGAGNAATECSLVGDFDYAFKIDSWDQGDKNGTYNAVFPSHTNVITISGSDGTYFDWSATYSIGAVIVKAGQGGANVWFYDPQVSSDQNLFAPNNPSGQPADVSHVTFCWNEDGDKKSAEASATVQGCQEGDVNEPVVIETEGVVMTITYPDGVTTFTHPDPVDTGANPDTYKGLPVGTYSLAYAALPDYEIPTDPPLQDKFVIGLCEIDKESATATAKLGACTWTLGDGSLTPVTITVTNAKMTLNGKLYEPKVSVSAETVEETFDLKLPPGKYPYTWESIDLDLYTGAGAGTLNVVSCVPGEEKQEDPKPDVASSGALPSLFVTAAPFLSGTLGMSLSYTILKQKFSKRH